MNEILDLQRDLHANNLALCEEHTFGTRTLLFAFHFLSERVALCSMLGDSPRLLLTLQLSVVCVLASGMRSFLTHDIAGSTGISCFFLEFQLVYWVFQYPIDALLSFV